MSLRRWLVSLKFRCMPAPARREKGHSRRQPARRRSLGVEPLEERLAPAAFPHFDLVAPAGSRFFGAQVVTLSTGNLVVTDANGNGGAAYLFNGHTGALISALTGLGDGPTVTALTNGNYVVDSPSWNGGQGAVTWGSGTTGVSGTVSAANSLIGSTVFDHVGALGSTGGGITALANGNYVVASPTWGSLGVGSPGRGAVTWGNGTTGAHGVVSAANSLVGSSAGDAVGSADARGVSGITALMNGNYVVDTYQWGGGVGAVTWGNGTTGITGTISAANSLVGSIAGGGGSGDNVGWDGVTALTNGNYAVDSSRWNGRAGAVTWGNGTTGVSGVVSAANSLVGSNAYPTEPDLAGGGGITALTNGNYVVASPNWAANSSTDLVGAVTWGNGTTGTTGFVSATNSLTGSAAGDQVGSAPAGVKGVTALANGNYVVDSYLWNGQLGAATWGNGMTGTVGVVSAANSLVGSNPGDEVGNGGITALTNGNYVVDSSYWNGGYQSGLGAATWGNGMRGITGAISAANSLVGSFAGDEIGGGFTAAGSGGISYGLGGGVVALTNGNFVVVSPAWYAQSGAVTWGNGTTGITGTVSAANSLIGNAPGNELGGTVSSGSSPVGPNGGGVTALTNGNYVVLAPSQQTATWGNGTTGTKGTLSTVQSLGGVTGDVILINALPNGNYVVILENSSLRHVPSSDTWVNGATGSTLDGQNTIDAQNSLMGVAGAVPLFGGGVFVATNPAAALDGIAPAGLVTLASPDPSLLPSVRSANFGKLGAYRPSDGSWSLDSNGGRTFDPATSQVFRHFSPPGVTGVAGDWTGSGRSQIGDFSNGVWHLDLAGTGAAPGPDETFQFGQAGDQPVVGDWDGNPSGRDELGVFRTAADGITGEFILDVANHRAMDGSNLVFTFGYGSDHIIVGDWSGNGTTKVGVYRDAKDYLPADAGDIVFSVNSNGDHATFTNFVFGLITDKVVIGDWTGDGKAKVGVYRDGSAGFNAPGVALFSLDSGALMFNAQSQVFLFGFTSDQFVSGDWPTTPPLLHAEFAADGRGPGGVLPLTEAQLAPVLQQAIANWAAQGYDFSQLSTVPIHIAPLAGSLVGWTDTDGVTLSPDAAGWGWSTDLTTPVAGAMDLLTVVEHELGHELGFSDVDPAIHPGNLMDATLPIGVRRLP